MKVFLDEFFFAIWMKVYLTTANPENTVLTSAEDTDLFAGVELLRMTKEIVRL